MHFCSKATRWSWSAGCFALQGVTARIRAARVGGEYSHPYDLGLCGNLHAVLGSDASCWCVPDRPAADGSGLSYPTSWDAG